MSTAVASSGAEPAAAPASAAAAAASAIAAPLMAWSVRDQLLLTDLVLKHGTQNWVSPRPPASPSPALWLWRLSSALPPPPLLCLPLGAPVASRCPGWPNDPYRTVHQPDMPLNPTEPLSFPTSSSFPGLRSALSQPLISRHMRAETDSLEDDEWFSAKVSEIKHSCQCGVQSRILDSHSSVFLSIISNVRASTAV